MPEEKFLVKRFNGNEEFKISYANWNLYEDEGRDNLCLYIECEEVFMLSEELEYISEFISWELNLVEDKIDESLLTEGFEAFIPEGYDDSLDGWITNLYFAEHQGTDKNSIRILKRDGDRLLIQITGETCDLNYYDGSKPPSGLVVQSWFEKNYDALRSKS